MTISLYGQWEAAASGLWKLMSETPREAAKERAVLALSENQNVALCITMGEQCCYTKLDALIIAQQS